MDINKDTSAKVINAFIQILTYELDREGKEDIFKANFMNDAMSVYTKRKSEIDTLARTFENLTQSNSTFKMNISSRLSPKSKTKTKSNYGNINGYSQLSSKGKDISSRLKISGLTSQKSKYPEKMSNFSRILPTSEFTFRLIRIKLICIKTITYKIRLVLMP